MNRCFSLLYSILLIGFVFSGCTSNKEKDNTLKVVSDNDYLKPPLFLAYIAHDSSNIVVFKDSIVKDSDVNELMSKLNWSKSNVVWLENEQGDVLEVVGGRAQGGFSARYINHDREGQLLDERVVSMKGLTENDIRRILKHGIREPDMVREAYFWAD